MQAIRVIGAMFGVLLAVATSLSVLRALVMPGGRVGRATRIVVRATSAIFRPAAGRLHDFKQRDRLLAFHGPLIIASMFAVWLTGYFLAFGFMLWPATGSFAAAMRESGSSLLTLGFDSTNAGEPTIVDFLAGATGLIVVALQIAYLPTIYSAYNRRETEVTLVAIRAGRPSWGPELLARSRWQLTDAEFPVFFSVWERWAADVSESHASYPVLIRFRSLDPLSNWLISLLAVMDAAALYHSLCPETAPIQARLAIQMGFTCMRRLADTIGLPYDSDPHPDAPLQLTEAEFMQGIERLRDVDFPMERTPEDAWAHFRGWRVNYESIVYHLAYAIEAPPALWSGPRRGGLIAKAPVRPANRRPEDPEGLSPLPRPSGARSAPAK